MSTRLMLPVNLSTMAEDLTQEPRPSLATSERPSWLLAPTSTPVTQFGRFLCTWLAESLWRLTPMTWILRSKST